MSGFPPKKRYYPLYWLLLAISKLPFPVLYLLSDFFRLILYRFLGYRKKVIQQNLERSYPEKSSAEIQSLIAAFYRNLCDVIVETLKLATIRKEEMQKRAQLKNPELILHHIQAGTPVIIMGSHQANWEWALPAGAVHFNFPVDGIYKILNNEFFEWYMLRTRTRFGQHLFDTKETLREFIRRKKIPRAISMLSDQIPPRGEIQYWTTFLNQETAFYVGGDKLATTFKYPVYFIECIRLKRGFYEYRFVPILDGETLSENGEFPITERYARLLQKSIRENPADYLWSHKRWKSAKIKKQPILNVQ